MNSFQKSIFFFLNFKLNELREADCRASDPEQFTVESLNQKLSSRRQASATFNKAEY